MIGTFFQKESGGVRSLLMKFCGHALIKILLNIPYNIDNDVGFLIKDRNVTAIFDPEVIACLSLVHYCFGLEAFPATLRAESNIVL